MLLLFMLSIYCNSYDVSLAFNVLNLAKLKELEECINFTTSIKCPWLNSSILEYVAKYHYQVTTCDTLSKITSERNINKRCSRLKAVYCPTVFIHSDIAFISYMVLSVIKQLEIHVIQVHVFALVLHVLYIYYIYTMYMYICYKYIHTYIMKTYY